MTPEMPVMGITEIGWDGYQMAKKILIVEDDDNIRELLRLYLEREDYEIIEAENGAVGMTRFKADSPDMILLDMMMPVMDGWQVCREIRESGSTTPIIMITAKGDGHSEGRLRGAHLSGGSSRPQHHRRAAAHQRRRSRLEAHPSEICEKEDLSRMDRQGHLGG